ncbi:AP2/ERF and B3 domain-containing transcription factor At1g50680-like [Humulus lupulus]|uniref:AP2/ERF and B3 domain-containing transcription factor At1g50680-like n=1 Tax=Humulus lupulus TaxID=3486 RepID=UPI002B40155A|nr:AP2/ERF and B3 domain-containing transcription factor At1g50680-like [Humulus lupulus]XP_062078363.1 AP2/ERF and B3 domain-containing transcription factor At1g50680-like [Humulus lupulus]
MEDDMSSIVLNGGANGIQEAADSNGSVHSLPPSKRAKTGSKSSSAKYKGTVKQQNGHWGAQIYANHQRIWLGTFKLEKEAAMAYDSAAIRLRCGDSHRNFPWTKATAEEPKFQRHYSTDTLLNMIKDGSYQAKFEDFLRNICLEHLEKEACLGLDSVNKGGVLFKQLLFQKELTPSDVGKLNRLVIPKKYATKYLPRISEEKPEEKESHNDGMVDDMEVVLHDNSMRSWKFKYCYWRSSQSFVFTRGWSRFVKEKGLKANDTIAFYLSEQRLYENNARAFAMIEVVEDNSGLLIEGAAKHSCLGVNFGKGVHKQAEADKEEDGEVVVEEASNEIPKAGNSGFRLFGVQII